jgi:hypothetical protein
MPCGRASEPGWPCRRRILPCAIRSPCCSAVGSDCLGTQPDRFLWVCLPRLWVGWRSALAIFKPETVIRWHRTGFRLYWRWKSRGLRLGRRQVPPDVQDLIRKMSLANPLWGAP